jgi:hypothetical protein
MRRFFLSSGFALFLLGAVALSSAEARPWWRRGWYDGYYYPAYSYSYTAPETVYYPPATTYVAPETYVAPQTSYYPAETTTSVAPAYSGGYYYTPRYYSRPYYGGYWSGFGPRVWWGWRR